MIEHITGFFRKGHAMNCQEAQACIQPFITHQLSWGRLDSYMKHIASCPSCREDLEIHYILEVGLELLDEQNSPETTTNLTQALQTELDKTSAYLELRRSLTSMRRSTMLAALGALALCAVLFWGLI